MGVIPDAAFENTVHFCGKLILHLVLCRKCIELGLKLIPMKINVIFEMSVKKYKHYRDFCQQL